MALPTIQALFVGHEVCVVEHCRGDVSELAHRNAMQRVMQAGAVPVMAIVTWLALLPQVIALSFRPGPLQVPFLAQVALSTAIPVAAPTWFVTPWVTRALGG